MVSLSRCQFSGHISSTAGCRSVGRHPHNPGSSTAAPPSQSHKENTDLGNHLQGFWFNRIRIMSVDLDLQLIPSNNHQKFVNKSWSRNTLWIMLSQWDQLRQTLGQGKSPHLQGLLDMASKIVCLTWNYSKTEPWGWACRLQALQSGSCDGRERAVSRDLLNLPFHSQEHRNNTSMNPESKGPQTEVLQCLKHLE